MTHGSAKASSGTFAEGQAVYSRTRREHGVYVGPDEMDPSGATSWVDFGDDEVLMVSTHTLDAA